MSWLSEKLSKKILQDTGVRTDSGTFRRTYAGCWQKAAGAFRKKCRFSSKSLIPALIGISPADSNGLLHIRSQNSSVRQKCTHLRYKQYHRSRITALAAVEPEEETEPGG